MSKTQPPPIGEENPISKLSTATTANEMQLPWRPTVAGILGILVGIGLGRFAFTPLLPELIEAGWFESGPAAYLSATNLVGYLLGAILARTLSRYLSPGRLLLGMMSLVSVSFFACAGAWPFAWFFIWRFLAGFGGAVLLVTGPAYAMQTTAPGQRGLVGGIIFAGVGLGIMISGTLIPFSLEYGLSASWMGLGGLATILTLVAWWISPVTTAIKKPVSEGLIKASAGESERLERRVIVLFIVYSLTALGLVPHMVFLVDYVARDLAFGIGAGSLQWVWFGIGATVGPLLAGRLGDKFGFRRILLAGTALEAFAVVATIFDDSLLLLTATSIVVGAYVPGGTTLVLGRLQELVQSDLGLRLHLWGIGTTAFSIGQAAGAYALAYLFANGFGYSALFCIGAGALGLAFVIDVVWGDGLQPE